MTKRSMFQTTTSRMWERWLFMALIGMSLFSENTGKLQILEMRIPDPFIFGASAELVCDFGWDKSEVQQGRHLYSVKWYKDGEEIYRFVPSEDPVVISYAKPGVKVDESRSTSTRMFLKWADWNTAGSYRCEVTADDYETIFKSQTSDVVAVPLSGPTITGQQTRYALGDIVNLNCSSNSSDPLADIFWYINSEAAYPHQVIDYPWIREPTNLMTRVSGLQFRITSKYMKDDPTVKVKCSAMLLDIYLKSNEISFEVDRPTRLSSNLIPALESRDGKLSKQQTSSQVFFDDGLHRPGPIPSSSNHAEKDNSHHSLVFGTNGASSLSSRSFSAVLSLSTSTSSPLPGHSAWLIHLPLCHSSVMTWALGLLLAVASSSSTNGFSNCFVPGSLGGLI